MQILQIICLQNVTPSSLLKPPTDPASLVFSQLADFHMSYLLWKDYRIILDPLLQEFWAQGDLEKSMGREIDKMLDRKQAKSVPEIQVFFALDTVDLV